MIFIVFGLNDIRYVSININQ